MCCLVTVNEDTDELLPSQLPVFIETAGSACTTQEVYKHRTQLIIEISRYRAPIQANQDRSKVCMRVQYGPSPFASRNYMRTSQLSTQDVRFDTLELCRKSEY